MSEPKYRIVTPQQLQDGWVQFTPARLSELGEVPHGAEDPVTLVRGRYVVVRRLPSGNYVVEEPHDA